MSQTVDVNSDVMHLSASPLRHARVHPDAPNGPCLRRQCQGAVEQTRPEATGTRREGRGRRGVTLALVSGAY